MKSKRLEKQIKFLLELDRLKNIKRRSYITDSDRLENTAEHSWHVAVMAMLFAEYSKKKINANKMVRMLLVHDIVEIEAGDTYCYDEKGAKNKERKEKAAAKKLFGLLPHEQGIEFSRLWKEFEACRTKEAQFAAALDRLLPLLHNYHTKGKSWRKHGVESKRVLERNKKNIECAPKLWLLAESIIKAAVKKGYLKK